MYWDKSTMFAFVLFVHRVWVEGFVVVFYVDSLTAIPSDNSRSFLVSDFNLGGTTHTANTSA